MTGELIAGGGFVEQLPDCDDAGVPFAPVGSFISHTADDAGAGERPRHRAETARVDLAGQLDGTAHVVGRRQPMRQQPSEQYAPAPVDVAFTAGGERLQNVLFAM